MPKKQQTNNKMFNRKKSKACYDKHDPHSGRNKDRREGGNCHGTNTMVVDSALAYRPHLKPHGERRAHAHTVKLAKKLDDDYKNIKVKERRTQNKVNHRKGTVQDMYC